MALRSIASLFFLSMLFSACQKDVGIEGVINLNPEFELFINQSLSDQGGVPSILIRTIEEQECSNSYISYQKIFADEGLTLRLNNVGQEGACEKENLFIEEDVVLDFLSGTEPITISLREVVKNKGAIIADVLKINLDLDSNHGFKISRSQINRIQPQMFWGTFTGIEESLVMEYFNQIKKDFTPQTGDYGHFYINQNNEIFINSSIQEGHFKFIITTESDFESIKARVEELKEINPDLVFQATNYDGRTLNIQ